jgi:hypothetical protein
VVLRSELGCVVTAKRASSLGGGGEIEAAEEEKPSTGTLRARLLQVRRNPITPSIQTPHTCTGLVWAMQG